MVRELTVETVTEPVNRNDEVRILRVVFYFVTQPENVNVDRAREWRPPIPPHVLQQGTARNCLAAIFDEITEQAGLAFRKLNPGSVSHDFTLPEIDVHTAK